MTKKAGKHILTERAGLHWSQFFICDHNSVHVCDYYHYCFKNSYCILKNTLQTMVLLNVIGNTRTKSEYNQETRQSQTTNQPTAL